MIPVSPIRRTVRMGLTALAGSEGADAVWADEVDAGTGLMHEAFAAGDPSRFSRPWFAWANSLFGELIVDLARRRPALLA